MTNKSESLQKEYQNRFQGADDYREGVWKIICSEFFSKFIKDDAILLDLGAGWGEFSRNIHAGKKYAMDLNPDCGVRVEDSSIFLHQDCSERWPIDDDTLDVVFTSNFLEHLPSKEKIEQSLDEALRCLKPKGKIICLGPNIKYVPGAYWDFWDHYVPITDESIAEILILKGFNVQKKVDRFLPYSMSVGHKPPLFALSLYLKLPFFWRFFGKQFLVVAEKPE